MKVVYLVAILPYLVCSWWDVGHMLTAAIAEKRLQAVHPYAYVHFRDLIQSINNMVDNRSRTLIESACWPDDIKSSHYNMHLWDQWHFINKPYVPDGVFPVINYTLTAINSVAVIQNAVKVLQYNINKTTAERALFARYLVHVTGDIHQPLHSVAMFNQTYKTGDRGGNSLSIYLENNSKSNLHSFWDAGGMRIQNDSWFLVRPLDNQNLTAIEDRVKQLMNEYGNQVEELAKNIDPAVWAMQSLEFAKNTTYPFVENTNQITDEYAALTYETSKKRLTLAGYRMANLIISIYDSATINQDIEESWKYMKKFSEKVNQSIM